MTSWRRLTPWTRRRWPNPCPIPTPATEAKGFDDADDPYIYFYENFLAAYDAKQRECRGVYYTPPPVVKFIVRAVDDLLRRDFGLPNGLAETDTVTALDFAAGTGTFMLEMIRSVISRRTAGTPRHAHPRPPPEKFLRL